MLVFVATYTHKDGIETRVYQTRESALAWGESIEKTDDESFRIECCVVEPLPENE